MPALTLELRQLYLITLTGLTLGCMVNVVLVTTRPRNGRVARDLEDYLLVKLGKARIVKSRFSGLLIIEAEVDPRVVSRVILNSPFIGTAVFRVVPVIEYVNELNFTNILSITLPKIRERCSGLKVLVRCRARGRGIGDSQCELELARRLKEQGVNVGVNSPNCLLLVECWEGGCGILMDRLDLISGYAFINIK